MVAAWYWCIGAVLLFTKYGHSFFDCLISLCFPGWSRRRINQIMRNDPDSMRLLIRGYVLRQQRRMKRIARENAQQQAHLNQIMRNDPDSMRLSTRGHVLRQQRRTERTARKNTQQQANLTELEQPDNNGQPINTQQAAIPEEQVPTRKLTSLVLRTRLYSGYGFHQKAKDSDKKGDDDDGDYERRWWL
jgi:hypothetical protein